MPILSIETPGFSVEIYEDTTEKLLDVFAEVICWHLGAKATPGEEPKKKNKAKNKAEAAHEAKMAIVAEVEAVQDATKACPIDARAVLSSGSEVEDTAPNEALGEEGPVVPPVEKGHAPVARSLPTTEPALEVVEYSAPDWEGYFQGSFIERKERLAEFLTLSQMASEEGASLRVLRELCNFLQLRIGLSAVRAIITKCGGTLAELDISQRADLYSRLYMELA